MIDEGAPDAHLVHAAQAGNATAFEVLYRRHHDLVFRICISRLRDRRLAEDATQETFAKVLSRLDRFEGGDLIAHYLARTARFTCSDRSTARRRSVEVLHGTTDYAEIDDVDASVQLDAIDDRIDLGVVLADLRDTHVDLLIEHHVNDTPLKAMAKQLSSTAGSIAVRLHRARKAAREVAESKGVRALVPAPLVERLTTWLDRHRIATQTAAVAIAMPSMLMLAAPADQPPPPTGAGPGIAVTTASPMRPHLAVSALTDGRRRPPDPPSGPSSVTETTRSPVEPASDPEPTGDLPSASIPLTGRGVGPDQPGHPDHEVVVQHGESVRLSVAAGDEPVLDEPMAHGCEPVDSLPVASCRSSDGSD